MLLLFYYYYYYYYYGVIDTRAWRVCHCCSNKIWFWEQIVDNSERRLQDFHGNMSLKRGKLTRLQIAWTSRKASLCFCFCLAYLRVYRFAPFYLNARGEPARLTALYEVIRLLCPYSDHSAKGHCRLKVFRGTPLPKTASRLGLL